jgi:hypothetical protein
MLSTEGIDECEGPGENSKGTPPAKLVWWCSSTLEVEAGEF